MGGSECVEHVGCDTLCGHARADGKALQRTPEHRAVVARLDECRQRSERRLPQRVQQLELEAEASALRALKQTASSTEDVFGNRPKQTSDTIVCTNCATQVSANRYAPHLERCMLGRGRASARAARDSMRGSE